MRKCTQKVGYCHHPRDNVCKNAGYIYIKKIQSQTGGGFLTILQVVSFLSYKEDWIEGIATMACWFGGGGGVWWGLEGELGE